MFYKEQLLNESNTEGPQTRFCPQKFCNYLIGRRKEPGFSQRFTGVRQEATDKFKYEKLRLNLRKKNFHLRVANIGAGCPKRLWTLITADPQNSTRKGPKQAHPTGPALSRRLGPHTLLRSLQPACSYDSMKLYFGCTTRQILLFFLFISIIIFICTDLPGRLKTGTSFQSMLRIREVPNKASYILLVLMRTTEDVLLNRYWQHLSKSRFFNLKTWERNLFF